MVKKLLLPAGSGKVSLSPRVEFFPVAGLCLVIIELLSLINFLLLVIDEFFIDMYKLSLLVLNEALFLSHPLRSLDLTELFLDGPMDFTPVPVFKPALVTCLLSLFYLIFLNSISGSDMIFLRPREFFVVDAMCLVDTFFCYLRRPFL